ncbi:MAG: glucosaminidase domain-containing protein [Paludibacteraceae bacterium]|nr:glucosaminidase domain-containing protein [Paludibacteraceae bacterium]
MKKVILLGLAMVSVMSMQAVKNQKYVTYIEQWQSVAAQQEEDYGIPAAITLAQALLESSAGTSELAVNANNHFGIKCAGDWLGDVYRYDDDARGECFRVYTDAAESFRDHSLFLKKDRYKTLYDIDVTNYKAWAYRLRECGYATDPLYAQKLIRIIEEYELAPKDTTAMVSSGKQEVKKAVMVKATAPIATFAEEAEPEYVEPLSADEERTQFFLSHAKQKMDGHAYVVAQEGDTYANVAFRLNYRERQLREWNDALGRELKVGDRIYLGAKKLEGAKEKMLLWVHPGESLWYISQRECVKIDKIREYNGFSKDVRVFKTRQQILMRKPQ